MKKIALMIVAAAAIFAAVPASAQTVVIDPGGMHRDRGVHRSDGIRHRDRSWRSRAQYRNDSGRRHHRSHRPGIVIGR